MVIGNLYERDYCIWNLVWKEGLWWEGTYMRGITASEIWSEKRVAYGERGLIWEGLLHLKSGLKRGSMVRGDLYERDYCIWNLVWKEELWWDGTYMRGITVSEIWSEKRNFGERGLIWEGLLHLKSGLKRRWSMVRGNLYERDYCMYVIILCH